jgi:hypothetical protein
MDAQKERRERAELGLDGVIAGWLVGCMDS